MGLAFFSSHCFLEIGDTETLLYLSRFVQVAALCGH